MLLPHVPAVGRHWALQKSSESGCTTLQQIAASLLSLADPIHAMSCSQRALNTDSGLQGSSFDIRYHPSAKQLLVPAEFDRKRIVLVVYRWSMKMRTCKQQKFSSFSADRQPRTCSSPMLVAHWHGLCSYSLRWPVIYGVLQMILCATVACGLWTYLALQLPSQLHRALCFGSQTDDVFGEDTLRHACSSIQ